VLGLARRGSNGSRLQLPGGVDVRRENDALIFCARQKPKNREADTSAKHFAYTIPALPASIEICVPELGCVFRFRVIDWPAKRGDTKNIDSVLDRDALHFPLVLRNWRPGDKLRPVGHRGAQKLKRLLNQKRISRWERDGWPVLNSGGTLAWARGFAAAAEFAAREQTRCGVEITEEVISPRGSGEREAVLAGRNG